MYVLHVYALFFLCCLRMFSGFSVCFWRMQMHTDTRWYPKVLMVVCAQTVKIFVIPFLHQTVVLLHLVNRTGKKKHLSVFIFFKYILCARVCVCVYVCMCVCVYVCVCM